MKQTVSDILNCLANLSSDEVFTSPELANRMLDMLPQELFRNPDTKFLDPCSKSGVFLREIAKRLLVGLEAQIPDLQQRIDHIMGKQLFGIALTQLTAEMSRRTLYCAKKANGEYSVAQCFGENEQGNLRYMRCEHIWVNGKCSQCGANRAQYDRVETIENYAYPFIHKNLNEIFKNMQFDVIIGNPPYQMSDGGDTEERQRGGAIPLYHKFIQQAKKLSPRFLIMIVPSRWFAGGRGLDEFRDEMLHDERIRNIVDYPLSSECFPGVEIKGGVCYFLWDRDNKGKCIVKTIRGDKISLSERKLLEDGADTFIRYNEALSILNKVNTFKEKSFIGLVSSMKPFGLRTYVQGRTKYFPNSVTLYANKTIGYVSRDEITQNKQWIDEFKVFITRSYGAGEDFPHQILNKPLFGDKNSACTETYLLLGPCKSKIETENLISYIKTRFFRFMVLLRKNTQDAPAKVYQFVPLQDFSHPWTDEMLYEKYGLTEEEINFIESMIKPME
ncbi:MAG: Eco57I restriction-modification methylase domain-containing protein [Bacteroidia bacterium]|nr:Eco57I restriction-modification methylase domain-containing protein [Bacteroidia bacterium]